MSRAKTDGKHVYGAVFLDPEHVGSSIRWRVQVYRQHGRRFSAEIALTDCSRTIDWSAWGSDGVETMRRKVGAAIAEFEKIQAALEIAAKHYKKIAPRKRKKAAAK